jgi:alpha-L-fucosidase
MKNSLLKAVFLGLILSAHNISAQGQTADNSKKMEWFKNAKLGIFIHWGIYSVNGIPNHGHSSIIISIMKII